MKTIDLNADLGEGGANDVAILALVSSANIACGGHAGDEATMRRTLLAAQAAGVRAGAHPGYPDRENFGRRELDWTPAQVAELVSEQTGALAGIAAKLGVPLYHVKPHGALYNQADRDPTLADAVVKGILAVSPRLILFAPPAGALAAAGRAAGLAVWAEGFIDRRYRPDATLVSRHEASAVIEETAPAVAQAVELAQRGGFETLCIHGDGNKAVEILEVTRQALIACGFTIARREDT